MGKKLPFGREEFDKMIKGTWVDDPILVEKYQKEKNDKKNKKSIEYINYVKDVVEE